MDITNRHASKTETLNVLNGNERGGASKPQLASTPFLYIRLMSIFKFFLTTNLWPLSLRAFAS